jgi:hypothetical protein
MNKVSGNINTTQISINPALLAEYKHLNIDPQSLTLLQYVGTIAVADRNLRMSTELQKTT